MKSPTATATLAAIRAGLRDDAATALVRLGELRGDVLSFTDQWQAWQLLSQVPPDVRRQAAAMTARVAVLGNHTVIYTVAGLGLEVAPRLLVESYHGDFDAWGRELLVGGSGLDAFAPDVVVLHLASLGLTTSATRLVDPPAGEIEDAVRAFLARRHAHVFVVVPEPLAELGAAAEAWHRRAVRAVLDAVDRVAADGLPVVAVDPLPVLLQQRGDWHAARYWAHGKIPMHPSACLALGRRLGRLVESVLMPRVKVIAVDCDNVLWGGEVGDVGPGGVNLSAFETGGGYLRVQRLLKEAVANGIVLVALSKNEEANVRAVFAERSEMLLSLDDFALLKVNWQPKAQNLQEAIAELNVGLDSVLFLDDSPFERGQMRAMCPAAIVPELPADADEYASVIAASGLLERPIVTDEDRRRHELYVQERRRAAARAMLSASEYLRGLELRLVAHPVGLDNLARVAQLIAKTNQFNLTTRRHTAEQVAAMAARPSAYAWCFQLLDRFGDAGIIGVLLAEAVGGTAHIDTLLMSCRVLGRTAERGMLEHFRRWAVARGVTAIEATYRPTAKSAPIASLLPDNDFTLVAQDGGYHYRRDASAPLDGDIFVEIVEARLVPPAGTQV